MQTDPPTTRFFMFRAIQICDWSYQPDAKLQPFDFHFEFLLLICGITFAVICGFVFLTDNRNVLEKLHPYCIMLECGPSKL